MLGAGSRPQHLPFLSSSPHHGGAGTVITVSVRTRAAHCSLPIPEQKWLWRPLCRLRRRSRSSSVCPDASRAKRRRILARGQWRGCQCPGSPGSDCMATAHIHVYIMRAAGTASTRMWAWASRPPRRPWRVGSLLLNVATGCISAVFWATCSLYYGP